LNSIATLSDGTSLPLTTVLVTERGRWEALFAQVAFPHFTQAWCYGEGKHAQGWSIERLVLQDEHGPVAICQVLIRRVLGLRLVSRINRGPLFLQRDPAPELQANVFAALRQRWRYLHRGLLLIAPALPLDDASSGLLVTAGFRQRRPGGWGSALIDLQPSLEEIRTSVASTWRNRLNAAIKAGVQVRVRQDPEAFDWMLECHAENMSRKGFVGPEVAFVRAMIDDDPKSFWVLQACLGSEPCAGILVARFGAHAETYLCPTSDAGRKANAHNLLYWTAIAEMKSAGCRALDVGGYTTTGKYGAFKRGMKGIEYRQTGEWLAF
jgi:lipid II:glycine glycyltransferase (peptidoglycan interpeptide bridge formation enzyme)